MNSESPAWIGSTRKAMALIRVSSHKQKDNNSPEVQRRAIADHAARLGLEIGDRYEEFQESAAKSGDRKKFHAALKRARDGGVRHLIVWVLDRSSRNFTDFEMLEEAIRADALVLHVAHSNEVLHAGSPDGAWLTAEMNTLTAKHYVRDLSRRATESMRAKAQRGWYPSCPPLGYINQKRIGDDGKILERDGTIALTPWGRTYYRRMFELRIRGATFEAIADVVLAEGLVPPKSAYRFRGAGRAAAVEKLLKNPFFIGEFRWGGELYRGNHEAVLTRAEWDRMEATFGVRTSQQRHVHDGLFNRPDFRLTCAQCGCAITYEPKKKADRTFKYYHCANGKKAHVRQVNVREEVILDQLGTALDAIRITEDLATAIADALNVTHKQAQGARDRERARFRDELKALEGREDEVYDDLKRGVLDDVGYRRQVERVRSERRRLTDHLEASEREIDGSYLVTAQRTLELAKNAKVLWESRTPEERRDLLKMLLQNPVLDGSTARYELRKPFQVLSEMRENEKWRGGWDSNPR